MSTIYLDSPPKPGIIQQAKTILPSRSWLKDAFPILQWLPKYNHQWFYGDSICAITVGIVVMPQSMAYAKIAGLPPQYGLYSSVIGCLVYPWLGTSKDISIGTTAINSLFMGQVTAILMSTPEFQNGTWTISHITSNLALITGLICLMIGFLHLGILFDFICQPAIAGFMAGTAVTIVSSQIGKILGIHDIKTTDPTYLIFGNTMKHLPQTQWDATLGIPAVIFLYGVKFGTKRLVDRYPAYSKHLTFFCLCRNAIVIIFATFFSFLINHFGHLTTSPFKILKDVPPGFQNMGVPTFDPSLLSHVIPNLVGVVVLQIMEHCSIATSLGKVADYKIQVNQEITSIGLSNIFGSFFGAYPMTGNFCRSAVMSKSGCRTPLTNFGVAGIVVLSIYCFTPALQFIPEAAVGAIVCHAVSDLIVGPKVWVKFWNTHPSELVIFGSAFLIALFTTIDLSVYVPVGISLVVQLYRLSRPKYAFLGILDTSDQNQKQQHDRVLNGENDKRKGASATTAHRTLFFPLAEPGILQSRIHPIDPSIICFQPREDLVFENVNYLYGKLMDEVKRQTRRGLTGHHHVGGKPWNNPCGDSINNNKPELSSIIFDVSGVHMMDYTAMEALAELSQMVDRYCGHPIPWYIVVGSSHLVRHTLLYAGFGRQRRKKVNHGIFAFHNDIKRNNKSSGGDRIWTPRPSKQQVCPPKHDDDDNKQSTISITMIEDVANHPVPPQQTAKVDGLPTSQLPDEKPKSVSTISMDDFDDYPPWCSFQEDQEDGSDDDGDNDHSHAMLHSMLAHHPDAIACIRDRYPYFFLSLQEAACAALKNWDASFSPPPPPPPPCIPSTNQAA